MLFILSYMYYDLGTIIMSPHLQTKKLRLREVKQCVWSHLAGKWQSQELKQAF